jgi:hypothetical protein
MSKSSDQLEIEIAEYLALGGQVAPMPVLQRVANQPRQRPQSRDGSSGGSRSRRAQPAARAAALPRYDMQRGWRGGDSRTLYAFVDDRTGDVLLVRPGGMPPRMGPAGVRIATRAEAEALWQSPLHSGWTVS